MFKHATICRTKRAQQALQEEGQLDSQDQTPKPSNDSFQSLFDGIGNSLLLHHNNETHDRLSSQIVGNWLASVKSPLGNSSATSCSSSPTPSLRSNSISRVGSLSSAPSSVFNSPSKTNPSGATRFEVLSMIKIYAQSLSQEVEYMTLHVNAQTNSRQIIRTLLRKFRIKHRDPNLFFLILERWIRKDGLKCKSVMVLSDDACPLQLQQCCSSPPHNDIKFILEMRSGALVKIFCEEVSPNTKYKCLSLSRQTTAEETIELMLNCLESGNPSTASGHLRQASSPDSTDSSSSSSSITSSSSGIESDLTTNLAFCHEPYCLVIEREGMSHKRTLESDEPVVDVYQNMLDESSGPSSSPQQSTSFIIKLKRFANQKRPSRPLPPIPLSRRTQLNNDANRPLQIVSTNSSYTIASRLQIDTTDGSPAQLDVPFKPKPAERTTVFSGNRRRYDPAQLAEDLHHLDLPDEATPIT